MTRSARGWARSGSRGRDGDGARRVCRLALRRDARHLAGGAHLEQDHVEHERHAQHPRELGLIGGGDGVRHTAVDVDRVHPFRGHAARRQQRLARDVQRPVSCRRGRAELLGEEDIHRMPGNLRQKRQRAQQRAPGASAGDGHADDTVARRLDQPLRGVRRRGLVDLTVRLIHLELHGDRR